MLLLYKMYMYVMETSIRSHNAFFFIIIIIIVVVVVVLCYADPFCKDTPANP